MNQSAYARRLGISRSMVNRLVKKGVIPTDASGDIDPDAADRAYLAALHPGYEHSRKARLPLEGVAPNAETGATSAPRSGAMPAAPFIPGGDLIPGQTEYKIHATSEKKWKALLAQADYEERIGSLVEAKKVEVEAFQTYREVRDALMNIPNRLAGVIASELGLGPGAGQDRVFEILTREITDALSGAAHAIREP